MLPFERIPLMISLIPTLSFLRGEIRSLRNPLNPLLGIRGGWFRGTGVVRRFREVMLSDTSCASPAVAADRPLIDVDPARMSHDLVPSAVCLHHYVSS
jgi:hypothetical protein